jgi:hypothetical protein
MGLIRGMENIFRIFPADQLNFLQVKSFEEPKGFFSSSRSDDLSDTEIFLSKGRLKFFHRDQLGR